MDQIINNILIDTKFDIHIKNIKNIQFNGYIYKRCNHVKFF